VKQVTVIGGGFAGLAATIRLCESGVPVTLLERRQHIGGRTFSFTDPTTGDTLDNGQHLFMRCYRQTRDLLQRIGVHDDLVFQPHFKINFRHPVTGSSQLAFPSYLPAPLNLLAGFLRFKEVKWRDILPLRTLKKELKKDLPQELTVSHWLNQCRQTSRMCQAFWNPLCIAALNEPPEAANARHLQAVLKEAFLGEPDGALLGYARKGLSNLFAKCAENYILNRGGQIKYGTAVNAIDPTTESINLHLRSGDPLKTGICISAVAPPALARMISPNTFLSLHTTLQQFYPSPILSVNLWFNQSVMEEPLCGLLGTTMEWAFNKPLIYGEHDRAAPGHLTLVASAARNLVNRTNDDIISLAQDDLNSVFPKAKRAKLHHAKVVRERAATYTLPLTCQAPDTQTEHPHFFLAGDWTNTGLPGTIESAVRSGYAAADAVLST